MLTRKQASFTWNAEEDLASTAIKAKLSAPPVLAHYHQDVPTFVSSDACDLSLGAVLEQLIDGELRPIDYYSCQLKPAETRYSTMEKECLAMVRALLHWRYELVGVQFVVFTDNSAVSTVLTQIDPGARVLRWVMRVSEYTFALQHRTGKSNVVADYLSRLSVPSLVIAPRPRQRDVPYDVLFALLKQLLVEPSDDIARQLPQSLWRSRFSFAVEDNVLNHVEGREVRVVPTVAELANACEVLHDRMGHFSYSVILAWLKERFWHPRLAPLARAHVNACEPCQRFTMKRTGYKFDGARRQSDVTRGLAIDFAGPFPKDEKDRDVVVAVEAVSGYPFAKAVPAATAHEAVQFLIDDVFGFLGLPSVLLSDHGSHFHNHLVAAISLHYGFTQNFSPPTTSQLNGQAERMIQSLQNILF